MLHDIEMKNFFFSSLSSPFKILVFCLDSQFCRSCFLCSSTLSNALFVIVYIAKETAARLILLIGRSSCNGYKALVTGKMVLYTGELLFVVDDLKLSKLLCAWIAFVPTRKRLMKITKPYLRSVITFIAANSLLRHESHQPYGFLFVLHKYIRVRSHKHNKREITILRVCERVCSSDSTQL